MSYTKNSWTDILPAAVKAKLEAIENALKYVNDERDKESTPGRALVEAATVADQRTALGLGDSATKNVGTAAGTVAAGDDERIPALGAVQIAKGISTIKDASHYCPVDNSTARDHSGNLLIGTLTGASYVTGLNGYGKAVALNGVTGKISFGDVCKITGELVIAAIINFANLPVGESAGIVKKHNGTTDHFGYHLSVLITGALYFYVSSTEKPGGSCVLQTSDKLSAGTHTIVAVYKPSTYMRIYIDGVLSKEVTTNVPASIYNNTEPLVVGANITDSTHWAFTIDELQILSAVPLDIVAYVKSYHSIMTASMLPSVVARLAASSSILGGAENRYAGKIISCLGDSITAIPSWVGLIGSDLNATMLNVGLSGSAIAYKAGMSAQSFVKRYVNLSSTSNLVIIFGGINDFFQDIPLGAEDSTTNTDFYGALNIILANIWTYCPTADLLFCTPYNDINSKTPNDQSLTLKDYRDAIIKRCAFYSVPVLDLYACSGLDFTQSALAARYSSDNTHPNMLGYRRLADRIVRALSNL